MKTDDPFKTLAEHTKSTGPLSLKEKNCILDVTQPPFQERNLQAGLGMVSRFAACPIEGTQSRILLRSTGRGKKRHRKQISLNGSLAEELPKFALFEPELDSENLNILERMIHRFKTGLSPKDNKPTTLICKLPNLGKKTQAIAQEVFQHGWKNLYWVWEAENNWEENPREMQSNYQQKQIWLVAFQNGVYLLVKRIENRLA